ncbi:hypothetical protein ACFRI7_23845 [Streptomyces sp. NPDC056716]|uniref:hypothetical protein n=1 Tax=unclassified Streptomyces TaxID=2593676 RepID=UPI0036BDC03F
MAIRLPVRIVVLVLVLPVRMVWDALVVSGRFLYGTVLRPVGRALFIWPWVALWRYALVPLGRALGWLGNVLLVVPSVWLYRHVLTPVGRGFAWVGRGLWAGVSWAGRGVWAGARWVGRGMAWLGRYLLVVPALWVHTWVLTPIGHFLAWCGKGGLWVLSRIVTAIDVGVYWIAKVLVVLPARALWRWVLAPVGRVLAVLGREAGAALGHAWRVAGRISLAVGRFLARVFRRLFVEPVRWMYRTVLTPVGHGVRDTVLRPAAEAARAVGRGTRRALASARETARQARADFRRMVFGEPRGREAVARREASGRLPGSSGRLPGSSGRVPGSSGGPAAGSSGRLPEPSGGPQGASGGSEGSFGRPQGSSGDPAGSFGRPQGPSGGPVGSSGGLSDPSGRRREPSGPETRTLGSSTTALTKD